MADNLSQRNPIIRDGIFISYRREGGSTFAGILYFALCKLFASERVFKDANTLTPGSEFTKEIDTALDRALVCLVLIDKHWVQLKNEKGNTRITLDNDLVRYEIRTALQNNVMVIPVLFEGGLMPRENELPDDIRPLCGKQAIAIHPESVMQDIAALIEYIQSKMTFLFDEQSVIGTYERLIKAPVATIKDSLTKTVDGYKRDFNYLKGFVRKYRKKK